MSTYGTDAQNEIYGGAAVPPRAPGGVFALEQWEAMAREATTKEAWGYISGGAGAGEVMQVNREAFYRWRILPRMLRDVTDRDLSIELFGHVLPTPFLLAPVGMQQIAHADAEMATARATARHGVPFILSHVSSTPLETVAEEMGDAPRWLQIYHGKDRGVTQSMLRRAADAGYQAIVITVDTQMLGWREFDLANAYDPLGLGFGIANYVTDDAFRRRLSVPPEQDMAAAAMEVTRIIGDAAMTWEDVGFIRDGTKLPILLKGILHPEDAVRALEVGADGIIVSNHGGRQVDGCISALDVLPEIVEATRNTIPVLMDSGIRRGADIFKALALGAKAVLIGRPYVYGLAAAGERGVHEIIRNLKADLDLTMALSGCRTVSEINRKYVRRI